MDLQHVQFRWNGLLGEPKNSSEDGEEGKTPKVLGIHWLPKQMIFFNVEQFFSLHSLALCSPSSQKTFMGDMEPEAVRFYTFRNPA